MPENLTPRQKKLIELQPRVESGELTKQEAMLQAGYSEESARQQRNVYGALRSNTKMQKALKKAGFTEEYLAEGIVAGTQATEAGKRVQKEDDGAYTVEERPDYKARGIYYKLGAELLDAFPNKVNLNADVGIEALLDDAEGQVEYPAEEPA